MSYVQSGEYVIGVECVSVCLCKGILRGHFARAFCKGILQGLLGNRLWLHADLLMMTPKGMAVPVPFLSVQEWILICMRDRCY